MKEFSIIAALDSKRGIGLGSKLPWRLKGDMEHFRAVSTGQGNNVVIMGRATWESLPEKYRPLPERLNVVLSRNQLNLTAGVLQARSLDEALALPDVISADEALIIGGANVYAQAITHSACKKLYLTEIEEEFSCDAFFPQIPPLFKKNITSEPMTEGDITYRFTEYEKK